MPQLLPFYFVNMASFSFILFVVILYVLSTYILPTYPLLFSIRMALTNTPLINNKNLLYNIFYFRDIQEINRLKIKIHNHSYSTKSINDINNLIIINILSILNFELETSIDNEDISFKTWLTINIPSKFYLNNA